MEKSQSLEVISNDPLQNIIRSLSLCKSKYIRDEEECKIIRETNSKLEIELKEARETEKSHRYHLQTSREMIGNLQETVSQLVYLKRDSKKLKEDLLAKDGIVAKLEKEKEAISQKNTDYIAELHKEYERQRDEIVTNNEKKIQQVQRDADTQIAQFACAIEELRAKTKELEKEHRDKMSVVVLEYEEKLQRSAAQITLMHDQHAGLAARTDANIDAYRRRLEELEEKLKQSQFKQYLAQNTLTSNYETHVERPYSVTQEPYPDTCSLDLDPTLTIPKPRTTPTPSQNRPGRSQYNYNPLQVQYSENRTPNVTKNDKKGAFNIIKKRKLYNPKELQEF